ncbi:hypothetical protein BV394_02030 [Brevirhabdus pacifica]|uniref:Uncharacterized protein n=1 Tax=Brevirhabdus pacifica TaxID=1267768 RepID=A0A1U7DFI0_9RHOB|nr:hypothetical protein [Brevirhabdus pacifica]APX88659.1 hypothetical protein BV394_02030 [Brevirhabdus pacifica]OWU79929.1 hypothetical protein ATO5_02720 [Loktanella sp. 22II-4b]PJJ86837.1 hypothetical protein CLV77_1397 [Brevirhabdus pacifica]
MHVTSHFRERVAQRVGGALDPEELAAALDWAISENRSDLVEYVGRRNRRGVRVFRFRAAPDGRMFLAVIDTQAGAAITLYEDQGAGTWGNETGRFAAE